MEIQRSPQPAVLVDLPEKRSIQCVEKQERSQHDRSLVEDPTPGSRIYQVCRQVHLDHQHLPGQIRRYTAKESERKKPKFSIVYSNPALLDDSSHFQPSASATSSCMDGARFSPASATSTPDLRDYYTDGQSDHHPTEYLQGHVRPLIRIQADFRPCLCDWKT